MEVSILTKESVAGTMKQMKPGNFLLEGFKRESYLRCIATQLKKEGYLFSVSRQEDGVKVTCLQAPESITQ